MIAFAVPGDLTMVLQNDKLVETPYGLLPRSRIISVKQNEAITISNHRLVS